MSDKIAQRIKIAQTPLENATFRRNSILRDWAEAAKRRDYDEAQQLVTCLTYADENVVTAGGKALTLHEINDALESASIPWYNDVCAEYIEKGA